MRSKVNENLVTAIPIVILLGVVSVFSYCTLFARFSNFDDEGFLMITLRQYLQGYTLYDEVYSQYGPFYYLSHRFLYGTMGIPITHDSVRWVFLGFWLFLTFVCFRVVLYLTRSRVAAILACVPFSWMGPAAEPAHPQGLVLVLIGLTLTLPTLLKLEGPSRSWFLGALAAGIASLLLVKLNIGVYLLLALLCTMLAMTRNSRWNLVARCALAFACFLLPPVLMMSNLGEAWAQKYALLTMATLAPILILLLLTGTVCRSEFSLRDWGWFGVSMTTTVVGLLSVAILEGSTLEGLVSVLILGPMKFTSIDSFTIYINRTALIRAAFSLLFFAIYLVTSRKSAALFFGIHLVASGKSAARTFWIPFNVFLMGFFGLAAMYYFYAGRHMAVWNEVSSFLWVALLPCRYLGNETSDRYFLRVFLVLTAAFQILHAYPLAGSQVRWSMIWIIPVAMVCLYDAWSALLGPAFVFRAGWAPVRKAVALSLVVIAMGITLHRTKMAVENYRTLEPMGLPGAERLRTSWLAAETYRWLTSNLRSHADTFIGLPGLNSLYFWTGKEPPTTFNAGYWMELLDEEKQETIATVLSQYPKASVIRNIGLAEAWSGGKPLNHKPLVAYINRNFRTIGSFGPFEFMVRKEREDVPLQEYKMFSMMKTQPVFVRARVWKETVGGVQVLVSSNNNEIRFPAPKGAGVASGAYGLHPDLCKRDNVTPVRLTIDIGTPESRVVLLERILKDCGMQKFQLPLRAGGGETVSLRTEAVSGASRQGAVYWTDIAIR